MGSCLVDQLQKRLINSVNDYLKKVGLNVEQARRVVFDSNEC